MAGVWNPGFYETESGKRVEVLAIRDDTVIGWCEGEAETWKLDGRYLFNGTPSGWDLQPTQLA